MDTEKEDSFLTCMEACDTIMLYGDMDINWVLANSGKIYDAFITLLNTDISELPDNVVMPILEVKSKILKYFGKDNYADYGGGPRAKVLHV